MVKDMSKMPKRKVTVDELLGLDDIHELEQYIEENKDNISFGIFIYVDGEGRVCYWQTPECHANRAVSMMERVKFSLLRADECCSEDDGDE